MTFESIPARLFKQAKNHSDNPAYYVRGKSDWEVTSYASYGAEVRTAAKALIKLGLEKGQTVCILGFNRPEWTIMDLATMAVGGAPAGIYTTCSPIEVQYIIGHAGARVVLLEDEGQWEKVKAQRDKLPDLEHVVMMKGVPKIDDDLVMSWEEFNALGEGILDAKVDDRLAGIKPDDLATLIYTSGTTGPPKGVMLSAENLTWTADAATSTTHINSDDTSLSYLPLSHIAEQMFTLHVPITNGCSVYFAESIDKVADNVKEVQPTVFFGVPRIWEKFHTGINAKLGLATGVKKMLVDWAMGVGEQVNHGRMTGKGEPTGFLGWKYGMADKLIFSKLKPAVGMGNARVCVSGAAPISREIIEFFAKLDILVLEVYGQSEDTGPTTFNRPDKFCFGTVGPEIPGCEVKIAADGEILVKGKNVFLGYFKDEAATNETLIDGWLHSGDLGKMDDDGFLHITGRKKEILITAGGKNIAPKNIEASLKNHPLINEAVVIGDRRKYLSCLMTLDPEASVAWAKDNGLNGDPLHTEAKVIAEVQNAVDSTNSEFARVEHIRKFTILHRNLSIEDGELTPTLKVKRTKVYEHFSDEIESMYEGA